MKQNNSIEELSQHVLDEKIVDAIQLLKDFDKYYPISERFLVRSYTILEYAVIKP